MMYFLNHKAECTGCTACMSACPFGCIHMERDKEGFLYPIASDKCIHCGKCERACPSLNKFTGFDLDKQLAFFAVTKNKKIWRRSASGGAFSEICNAFGDANTLICGAQWDGLKVEHSCVIGVENITPLCKSKYVASDLRNCFTKIKEHIVKGNKAIFCGTPCQVAGLRAFLGKDYNNLLLIDLICHGVGSPVVFEECVELTGKQLGIEPKHYGFRYKPTGHFLARHISYISDGQNKYLITNDQYNQLFLSQLCLRPSCGKNCIYRTQKRQGDITIADFNGADSIKDLSYKKHNYSSIIANTEKAISLLKDLKKRMKIYPCKIEDVKKYNPLFYKQTWFSNDREKFFKDFCEDSSSLTKWVKDASIYKVSIKRRIYCLLPSVLKRMVRKVLRNETK